MATDNKRARATLRAAVQIHAHLAGECGFGPLPVLYDHEWEELVGSIRRLEKVQEKGWQVAARSLLSDLDLAAASLVRRLDRFRSELPKESSPARISPPREIAADLDALADEFEELEINRQEKTFSLVTGPIELEDVYLGPFQIVLHWEEIGKGACYSVIAKDPHPAEANDDVTHPHVSSEKLCEGEGSTAIRKALAQGRVLDFFTLVRQVLETYNPESAYVALSRWSGGNDCGDCGYAMSGDESWSCERCGSSICDECRQICSLCDETHCGGCACPCHVCEETFCRGCLSLDPQTRRLTCESCLKKGETPDDEEPVSAEDSAGQSPECGEQGEPAPAVDPLCLAEAPLPA